MTKMRDKIRRQLRQLFLHPAVYMAMWAIPFAAHVAGDASSSRPSFGLAVASLASLCAQVIADVLVFSVLKPWRHPRRASDNNSGARAESRGRGGGRGNGGFVPCWPSLSVVVGASSRAAGRTRDQMLVDIRAARLRRDSELAERWMLRRAKAAAAAPSPRDWWDVRLGSLDEWDHEDDGDEDEDGDLGLDMKRPPPVAPRA